MNSGSTQTFNSPSAIEFRHVSLSFDGKYALRDVSFRLERGEMIFLTGASGSGKSVLMHLAMGLLKPDEGQIFIEGREIELLDETELLAIRGGLMGMVFQEDALFTGLTAYDNAAYRLTEHGWAEEDIERTVREVLRFVGLADDAEKFPEELSGGMKRRLEIARALVGWPSIMLFDEPTYGIDPVTAIQILELVIRARDVHRMSSVYVTKRLYEIPYLATHYATKDETGNIAVREADEPGQAPDAKVMLLEDGRVAFIGSPAEFINSNLPAVTYLTQAENGTEFSDYYAQDPWDKSRVPKEEILGSGSTTGESQ
jgi:phospholipid/cholesterol/gamma-HCH transport system ATP-binding protein